MAKADEAAELARRLLGGRSASVVWNGRVRAVVADRGRLSRYRGAMAAPGFRWSARAVRFARALQLAVARPESADRGESPLVGLAAQAGLAAAVGHLRPAVATVGTPKGPRYVVVRLVDERARPRVMCKVAVNEAADVGLEREARALDEMSRSGTVPALLARTSVYGHRAILTRFVDGQPCSTRVSAFARAGSALPAPQAGARSWEAAEHPWVVRLGGAEGLGLAVAGGLDLAAATDALPGRWPEVRLHGDFAPWNVIRCRDGRLVVIDWEESVPDGFVGVDLAHFVMATARLVHDASVSEAARLARNALGQHLGIGAPSAWAITLLAAAYTAQREDRNAGEAGSADFWRATVAHCAAELAGGSGAQATWRRSITSRT